MRPLVHDAVGYEGRVKMLSAAVRGGELSTAAAEQRAAELIEQGCEAIDRQMAMAVEWMAVAEQHRAEVAAENDK